MKLEVKKVERQSLPGFRTVTGVYRGRKGGPSPPREEFPSKQTSIPPFLTLNTYIPYSTTNSKEYLDIPITLTGNEETPN